MKFTDIKIGTRLFLLTGFLCAMLIVIGLIGIIGIGSTKKSLDSVYNDEVLPLKQLKKVSDMYGVNIVDTAHKVGQGLMTWTEGRENIQFALGTISEQWYTYTYDPSGHPAGEKRLIAEAGPLMKRADDSVAKLLDVMQKEDLDQLRQYNAADLYTNLDPVQDVMARLVDLQLETAGAEHDKAEATYRMIRNVYIVIIAVVAVLAFLLSLLISRGITRPLKAAVETAEHMALRDLTVQLPPDGRQDEVGVLLQAFRKMVQNLREDTRQVMEGANVLAASTREISTSTAQFASTATETAAAVSQTSTTMEEVRQTAQVSSQKAKFVSEIAQKAVQVSQTGQKSVDETVGGMGRIRVQMDSIAESIVRLSEQSQVIGDIIATVDDIAEQANLLAVNASIEAAKAGEQGKGFAVVAQEIKSLAEQSKSATAQVRSILHDIQKATSAAVMVTEQGSKAVEAGVKQSAEAGDSIRLMAKTITEAAQAVTQIAASAQQQYVGADQMAAAMESIQQASAQNVEGARQIETAARNLGELGQNLKQLLDRYKV